MNKLLLLTAAFSCFCIYAQESLLPGELKLDEITIKAKSRNLQKVEGFLMKYKKGKQPKDSLKVVTELYNHLGLITSKVSVNPKNPAVFSKLSDGYFNDQLMEYAWIQNNGSGIDGRTGTFEYDAQGRCILQTHSLARIKYSYNSAGKLATKSYHYNNGGSATKPWIHYYLYDENGWLKHVSEDPESSEQTYFYDSTGQLILNNYYPGVAYSRYDYDQYGNCTSQIDYEANKKGWDSTIYAFTYYPNGQIKTSGTIVKRGKLQLTEEYLYNSKGEMTCVFYLKRNRRKRLKRFTLKYD